MRNCIIFLHAVNISFVDYNHNFIQNIMQLSAKLEVIFITDLLIFASKCRSRTAIVIPLFRFHLFHLFVAVYSSRMIFIVIQFRQCFHKLPNSQKYSVLYIQFFDNQVRHQQNNYRNCR